MASHRPKVKPETREALVKEAGGKCANPGCPVVRTHLHHIREWAVYATHDEAHMIALCPSCHDTAHRGQLKISDETLYSWKQIIRGDTATRGHVYVEPTLSREAGGHFLQLGGIGVTCAEGRATIFSFPNGNGLSYRLIHGDTLAITVRLHDQHGNVVLDMEDGHYRTQPNRFIAVEARQGRLRITCSRVTGIIPDWVIRVMRTSTQHTFFAPNPRAQPWLDLEVVRPGQVRMTGTWWAPGCNAVVIIGDEVNQLAGPNSGVKTTRARPKPDGSASAVLIFNNGPDKPLISVDPDADGAAA